MEDESTRFIAQNWFTMPAPWVCEGWIMARALRKWIQLNENGELDPGDSPDGWPCSRIIVLEQQRPEIELLPGQARMHKGIMQTTWPQIRGYFEGMYETRRWDAD